MSQLSSKGFQSQHDNDFIRSTTVSTRKRDKQGRQHRVSIQTDSPNCKGLIADVLLARQRVTDVICHPNHTTSLNGAIDDHIVELCGQHRRDEVLRIAQNESFSAKTAPQSTVSAIFNRLEQWKE